MCRPSVPKINGKTAASLPSVSQSPAGPNGENAPSDEMQKQMAELERLDKESDSLPPDQIAANVEQRVAALQKLAELAPRRTASNGIGS